LGSKPLFQIPANQIIVKVRAGVRNFYLVRGHDDIQFIAHRQPTANPGH